MDIDLLIDGQPVAAAARFERRNPMTGAVATSAAAASVADVEKAVGSAANGFLAWSEIGPNARRALLLKAADLDRAVKPLRSAPS